MAGPASGLPHPSKGEEVPLELEQTRQAFHALVARVGDAHWHRRSLHQGTDHWTHEERS